MTTLHELLHDTSWDVIIGPATELVLSTDEYTKDNFTLEPLEKVFNELLTIEPKDSDGIIHVEHYHEEHVMDDDYIDPDTGKNIWVEDYEDVYGIFPSEHPTQHYALEFMPWEEWLGMAVDEQALNNYSPGQVIAYCLWEMTFYGFDQEKIQGKLKSLAEIGKRIQEGKEKWYSLEEVIDNISKKNQ